jgi:hypothetical protein
MRGADAERVELLRDAEVARAPVALLAEPAGLVPAELCEIRRAEARRV